MTFLNPYYTIPGVQSLRVEQITCWIEGHHGPKYIGSSQCSSTGNSFSGWIESSSGHNFTVHWHNNNRVHHMEGALYIDGVLCDTHIIPETRSFPEDKFSMANIGFAQTSTSTRRNFVFADVPATSECSVFRQESIARVDGALYPSIDHDTISESHDAESEVGTIRLEVRRVNIEQAESIEADYSYEGELLSNQSIVGSSSVPHHVRLGEEYLQPSAPIIIATRGSRIDQEPLYTFTFRYRPIEVLLARDLFPPQFRERPIWPSNSGAHISAPLEMDPLVTPRDTVKAEEPEYSQTLSTISAPLHGETKHHKETKRVRRVRHKRGTRTQVKKEVFDSD